MIAGTIVVSGALGDHPGYGMRRGTLIAGGHGALLPTFVETGTPDLVFVRLLAQSLKRLGAAQAGSGAACSSTTPPGRRRDRLSGAGESAPYR